MLRNLATSAMNTYKAQGQNNKSSEVTPYSIDLLEGEKNVQYDERQSYSQDNRSTAAAPISINQAH